MKKYTIKGNGTEEYGKHIIAFFEKLGGVNKLTCHSDVAYYFMGERNYINYIPFRKQPDHTEIELLPNGMAKGVWYKSLYYGYFKPIYAICGEYIYNNKLIKDYNLLSDAFKYFTPLTDLTEIQEFLPDGHEDKFKVNIEVDYKQALSNVSEALKEVINNPEPTDLIEPSTEYILKLIYEKWGELCLINAIDCAISQNDNERLKGKDAEDKAENLINKWQPKPKIWKQDGIIMISTDAPEGAVEYTQERLNGLLNINI